jgi:hypothetical protein
MAVVSCVVLLDAQTASVRVRWDRTPEFFTGKRAIVSLKDGTAIEGTWNSVTEETFTMQVEKTSRKQNVPKGLRTFSRSLILSLRVGNRRVRGRVIGSLSGFYGVVALAGASTGSAEALQGGWGIAAFGAGIVGYLAGSAYDRATYQIDIEP